MEDDLTFLDLVVLQRIEPDTVIERFGSRINSSFFDAANILGTLKQKGYVDFKTTYPGPSSVIITETGAMALKTADERSKEEVDELDSAILGKIADGYKDFSSISASINVRSGDLAVHLHKLVKKDLASYTLKSGRVELSLTENGFKQAGKSTVKAEVRPQAEAVVAAPLSTQERLPEEEKEVVLNKETMRKAKRDYYFANLRAGMEKNWFFILIFLVLALIVVIYLFLRS